MKRKAFVISVAILVIAALPFDNLQAQGSRKRVSCRTVDPQGNVLSEGNRCDWGWDECLNNPCPNPDGTLVEWNEKLEKLD